MLISRAIVIFTVVPLIGRMPGAEPIGTPFQSVMYWGGLRGAIALAIVLALPPFDYKDTLISLVMGAVLFTLVVQGLSIEKLVKFLGLDALSLSDSLAKLEGDKNARVEGLKRLNSLVSGGLFSQRISDNLREKSEQSLSELGAEIETLNSTMTKAEMARILAMRCLAREKARFYELFSHGLINESAYRELEHTIAVQIDEVRHRGLMPTVKTEKSIGKAVFEVITNMFEVAGARALAERLSTSSIIRDYDVAWGRYRAANSVLHGLDTIASEGNIDTATTAKIRQVYEEILTAAKSQVDEVAEQYPEFVETIQEQLGQRLLLVAEHESVEQAAEKGMINEGIAHTILKNQASRIRQLNQENMSACFEIEVTEILKKVPMFQGVSEAEHAFIGSYLRTKTVPRGKAIIRQGNAGDSIFLIARGIANVEVTEGDAVNHVATLYAGDFFGEAALLHGTPRNATTIAATPCSLYELKRQDLDRICAQHPKIRQTLEEVDRKRVTLGTMKD
jgi:CPA1 family monovalent cation:H+ antiporter